MMRYLFGKLLWGLIPLFFYPGRPSGPLKARAPVSGAKQIHLNQIGFFPKDPKIAVVEKEGPGYFYVIDTRSKDSVFRGRLTHSVTDPYSGTIHSLADFSALTHPGTYYLFVPSVGNSWSFSIQLHVYALLGKNVLKAFYFMRCSESLLPAFAGKWARKEGHPDILVYIHSSAASPRRPEGTVIPSPGGWYDAGDYNKYVVNSGISTGTLLSAYEDFHRYFDSLNTHIPESKNRIPDILDEVLWNLRWMMTMQDPEDGGVYHKLTDAAFDKMEMPDRDHARRFVVMKSTAASLDFAAVMAQASRVFRAFKKPLPGLADSCLHAASRAWDWSLLHPDQVYDQDLMNKDYAPAITTGSYGDHHLADEKYWAAVELFATTRDKRYGEAVGKLLPRQFSIPSWGMVAMLGDYTLFRSGLDLENGIPGLSGTREHFLIFCDSLLHQCNPAYQTVMGGSPHDFIWGSNAVAANQGIALVQGYLLTRDKKYLNAALGNLDYLLGRNATGYCFVTGCGSLSPMHPHHRPSIADGVIDPVPGMLVAGPNPGQQDQCPTYPTRVADESYTDDDRAYACNEIAINWNAPMAYLVNALEALSEGIPAR